MRATLRTALILALATAVLAPGAAHASTAMCNVPITMSDGLVLRANLWLPDGQGVKAPTVLTASGYNKDATNPGGAAPCNGSGGIATADTSLADKGYAVMLLD